MYKAVVSVLAQLLEAQVTDNVPFGRTFTDVEYDHIFVLHTSGYTGKRPRSRCIAGSVTCETQHPRTIVDI